MRDHNRNDTWQEGIYAQYKQKYICDTCEKYPCSANETKLMLSCPAYSPKPKPQTNADRIRSMSDEELADFLDETDPVFWNRQTWLDWLKKEVT